MSLISDSKSVEKSSMTQDSCYLQVTIQNQRKKCQSSSDKGEYWKAFGIGHIFFHTFPLKLPFSHNFRLSPYISSQLLEHNKHHTLHIDNLTPTSLPLYLPLCNVFLIQNNFTFVYTTIIFPISSLLHSLTAIKKKLRKGLKAYFNNSYY